MKLFKSPFLRLYKEGLSRIKVLGIVCASLTFFASVVSPITELVTALRESADVRTVEMLSTEELMYPLLLLMLFSPFFVFAAFSFLRRRNACDFYHALPYRRKTVYMAFACAAMTWTVLIAVVCAAARAIIYTVNPCLQFSFGQLVLGLTVYLIACLFLMGIASLSATLTGTVSSCLFIYALFLLCVRVVFFAYVSAFAELVPIVNTDFGLYAFFAPANFLPLSLLSSLLFGESVAVFTNAPLLVYFAVLGAASFALACLFFVRRKSESAACSAATPIAQHVFRFLLATPILLGSVSLFFIEESGAALLLLALSFIAYFLFELIFAGKSRRMLSALKFAPLMFAFGAIFAGVILLNAQICLHREVKAEDIVSISFDKDGYLNSYEDYATGDAVFEDDEIARYVADAYAATVNMIKEGTYRNNRYLGPYTVLDVAVQTKSGVRHYSLLMTITNEKAVEQLMLTHQSYLDAYMKLPSAKEVTFLYSPTGTSLTQEEWLLLWDVFASEFKDLPYWVQCKVKEYGSDSLFYLTVNGLYKGETFSSHYSVHPFMVETISALQSYLESQPAKNELLTHLRSQEALQNTDAGYSITFVYGENDLSVEEASFSLGYENSQNAARAEALSFLGQSLIFDAPFDASKPYVMINMDIYPANDSDDFVSGTLMYNISANAIEEILDLLDSVV